MITIRALTPSPARYSIRPCPNGCPGSGFLDASLKPISDMIDEPASERLLNASAIIDIDALSTPARYLPANKHIFKNIPYPEQSTP